MRPLSRHLLIWLATVLLALLMAAVPVLLDGAPAPRLKPSCCNACRR